MSESDPHTGGILPRRFDRRYPYALRGEGVYLFVGEELAEAVGARFPGPAQSARVHFTSGGIGGSSLRPRQQARFLPR